MEALYFRALDNQTPCVRLYNTVLRFNLTEEGAPVIRVRDTLGGFSRSAHLYSVFAENGGIGRPWARGRGIGGRNWFAGQCFKVFLNAGFGAPVVSAAAIRSCVC